jgi:hypothetical protein
VDTHVERLSKRFGLVPGAASVQAIERWLMALFPREKWCQLSHMLIWHGRRACKARGVTCSGHPICARFGVACELRDLPVTREQVRGTVALAPATRPASAGPATGRPKAVRTSKSPKKKAR